MADTLRQFLEELYGPIPEVDCSEERWEPVEENERYQVSNLGRVWDRKRDRRLGETLRGGQYLAVLQKPGGGIINIRLNRLVARAFVPARKAWERSVLHLDRDPANNRADNLVWVSASDSWLCNRLFPAKALQAAEKRSYSKPVILQGPDGAERRFERTDEAIRFLGRSPGAFYSALYDGAVLDGYRIRRENGHFHSAGEAPECWVPIPGYAGRYEASSSGKIQSVKDGRTKELTTTGPDGKPRRLALVGPDGKRVYRSASRLIAETFLPNPDGLTQVGHRNGDETDNRAENLEWRSRGPGA